ncbi:YadA-like family protein [Vibrio owensii]|uniref:YadA-like family protein n=1 Tax=Vibrio owensii TaxID=696485 RepID=UPI0005979936|nr:YadA-like family protein [Vibrio owensii]
MKKTILSLAVATTLGLTMGVAQAAPVKPTTGAEIVDAFNDHVAGTQYVLELNEQNGTLELVNQADPAMNYTLFTQGTDGMWYAYNEENTNAFVKGLKKGAADYLEGNRGDIRIEPSQLVEYIKENNGDFIVDPQPREDVIINPIDVVLPSPIKVGEEGADKFNQAMEYAGKNARISQDGNGGWYVAFTDGQGNLQTYTFDESQYAEMIAKATQIKHGLENNLPITDPIDVVLPNPEKGMGEEGSANFNQAMEHAGKDARISQVGDEYQITFKDGQGNTVIRTIEETEYAEAIAKAYQVKEGLKNNLPSVPEYGDPEAPIEDMPTPIGSPEYLNKVLDGFATARSEVESALIGTNEDIQRTANELHITQEGVKALNTKVDDGFDYMKQLTTQNADSILEVQQVSKSNANSIVEGEMALRKAAKDMETKLRAAIAENGAPSEDVARLEARLDHAQEVMMKEFPESKAAIELAAANMKAALTASKTNLEMKAKQVAINTHTALSAGKAELEAAAQTATEQMAAQFAAMQAQLDEQAKLIAELQAGENPSVPSTGISPEAESALRDASATLQAKMDVAVNKLQGAAKTLQEKGSKLAPQDPDFGINPPSQGVPTHELGSIGEGQAVAYVQNGLEELYNTGNEQAQQYADKALSDAKSYTDTQIAGINSRIDGIEEDLETVMATSQAVTAARPYLSSNQTNAIGVGLGNSGSQNAIAVGYAHRINENWTANANLSGTSGNEVDYSVGAGLSYAW